MSAHRCCGFQSWTVCLPVVRLAPIAAAAAAVARHLVILEDLWRGAMGHMMGIIRDTTQPQFIIMKCDIVLGRRDFYHFYAKHRYRISFPSK